MEPIRLEIPGLAAGGADAVENALRMVPGVLSVRSDPAGQSVRVEAVEDVKIEELIAAVQKAGYIATFVG
jgi:copper chaperone CopZ